jgi:hypothetical protein
MTASKTDEIFKSVKRGLLLINDDLSKLETHVLIVLKE